MDPRDALNITIKAFGLKAADIARNSGVSVQMLSRYRKKHQDMTSLNAFQVIKAIPSDARDFFWDILNLETTAGLNEKIDSAKSRVELFDLLVSAILEEKKQEPVVEEAIKKLTSQERKELLKTLAEKVYERKSVVEDSSSNGLSPAAEPLEFKHAIFQEYFICSAFQRLRKDIKPVIREELIENFDTLKPLLREWLNELVDQESLTLPVAEKRKKPK